MEEDNESPTTTESFGFIDTLDGGIVDSNRKRKLQTELFELPLSKHACFRQGSTSKFECLPELRQLQPIITAMTVEEESVSQADSDGGSNSFVEDSGATMSVFAESHGLPSPSTASWGFDVSGNQTYSSDDRAMQGMDSSMAKEDIDSSYGDGPINLRQILEEQLLELGVHTDCNKNDLMEQSGDNETTDTLYSEALNPNNYVVSSGRWNIDREGQTNARKPTIDKEFEQYFSMLML